MKEIEANYKFNEEVIVSGTLTGIGNIKGINTEVGFNPLYHRNNFTR